MLYHMTAFLAGVILDRIIGDPINFPHPIRWIGSLISQLTDRLLGPYLQNGRDAKKEKEKGLLLVIIVVSVTAVVTAIVIGMAYFIHPYLGVVIEAVLTCYALASKSLYVESMKVGYALENEGLNEARYAVSMIVGRDTDVLSEEGVIKAAVETVAENTSDGVIAPLLYLFLGGPVLGLTYKAVNTMYSMVGYHNDRYENFGYHAARLDDKVNYLPARISAIYIIVAAGILGKDYSARDALRIFLRDRFNHKSPNSAQTESALAGALRVRLAGDAVYFGKTVKKPYIGDDYRAINCRDIKLAGKLMFATEILVLITCLAIAAIIWKLVGFR